MAKYRVLFNADKCKGCELCVTFCPKGIIGMSPAINSKGYSPASVSDQEACIGCQSCALVCPDGAVAIYKAEKEEEAQ